MSLSESHGVPILESSSSLCYPVTVGYTHILISPSCHSLVKRQQGIIFLVDVIRHICYSKHDSKWGPEFLVDALVDTGYKTKLMITWPWPLTRDDRWPIWWPFMNVIHQTNGHQQHHPIASSDIFFSKLFHVDIQSIHSLLEWAVNWLNSNMLTEVSSYKNIIFGFLCLDS